MRIEEDFRLLESQYLDRAWQGIATRMATATQIKPKEHLLYYTKVFDLCVANDVACQQVYVQIKQHLRRFVIDKILAPLKGQKSKVAFVLASWSQFSKYLVCLSCVFSYVDRFHVPLVQAKTTCQLGQDLFKEVIYTPHKQMFLDEVSGVLLGRLKSDPSDNGAGVKDTLVAIIDFVTTMEDGNTESMQDLETAVLQVYCSYYEKMAHVWIQDLPLYDYLQVTQETLVQEVAYFDHLRPLFKGLDAVLTEAFYRAQQGVLLQNIEACLYGSHAFPRSKSVLGGIYSVYSRLDGGMEAIARAVYDKHASLSLDVNVNVKEITEAFYDSCRLVEAMDASDAHLKDAMSRVFKLVLEQPRVLIATFQGGDAKDLAYISWAFNLSRDKQRCLECYQACLAKRLLCWNPDIPLEKRALDQLHKNASKLYTLELDTMIQEAAAEARFKVLSCNKWPAIHDYKCSVALDETFATPLEAFKQDYIAQNNRKDLKWCYSASPVHLDIDGQDITCDVYQASVLLQLVKIGKPTSLQELATQMATSEESLRRVIEPMGAKKNDDGGSSLLVFTSLRSQHLQDSLDSPTHTCTVWFNPNFRGPGNFLRIKVADLYEQQDEKDTSTATTTLVTAENKLDCLLVAKLKSKNHMSLDALITWAMEHAHADADANANASVNSNVKFTREDIIKRIQDLCRRQYIKLDEERNVLYYIP